MKVKKSFDLNEALKSLNESNDSKTEIQVDVSVKDKRTLKTYNRQFDVGNGVSGSAVLREINGYLGDIFFERKFPSELKAKELEEAFGVSVESGWDDIEDHLSAAKREIGAIVKILSKDSRFERTAEDINYFMDSIAWKIKSSKDSDIDYTELERLKTMLDNAGIPNSLFSVNNGQGKGVFYPSDGNDYICDAVIYYDRIHPSRGYADGLLELNGKLAKYSQSEGCRKEGNLTAKEVFDRIKKHYEENK